MRLKTFASCVSVHHQKAAKLPGNRKLIGQPIPRLLCDEAQSPTTTHNVYNPTVSGVLTRNSAMSCPL